MIDLDKRVDEKAAWGRLTWDPDDLEVLSEKEGARRRKIFLEREAEEEETNKFARYFLKATPSQETDEDRLRRALTREMGREGTLIANRIISGESLNLDEATRMFNAVIGPNLSATVSAQARRVSSSVGLSLDEATINQEALAWARDYSFDLVSALTDTTRDVVSRAMQAYVATSGMTRRELERALDPAFGPARAAAIAVTETTRAYSEATNVTQRQLAASGITMERVWHTVGDALVEPLCAALDGLPESEWRDRYPSGPAIHVYCRCSLTLRLKE